MTPLEKVARAILERRTQPDFREVLVSSADPNNRVWAIDHDLELARAAIEALMEPSEEMTIAGWACSPACHQRGTDGEILDAYRAMLTKALEEK